MSIAIIGGGYAGLYCARTLLQQGNVKDVFIFEALPRVGGRVFTDTIDANAIEAGAGRFNKNHTLFWKLLQEYGLLIDIVELSPKKKYVKDGKQTHFDCDKYLVEVLNNSLSYSEEYLRSIPFKVLLSNIYAKQSLIDDIIYAFGYNTEMEVMNAWETLRLIESDFLESIKYYALRGGLQRLTEALVKDVKRLGGHIYTNTTIIRYDYNATSKVCTLYTKNNKVYTCTRTVFCVTKQALLSIHGVVEHNTPLARCLHMLGAQPLLRVYAKFPMNKGKVWFWDISRSTTNDIIRYVIPVNVAQGICMISYTDGPYAELWGAMSEHVRNETLVQHIRKIFPQKVIPSPDWIQSYYWTEGGHYWKPGYVESRHVYKNTKATLAKHGYIVCGELLSLRNHAWIEGALESVERSMHLLR